MPNVRDHDASVYLRLQGDALSVGGYESNPIFWEEVSGAGRVSGGSRQVSREATLEEWVQALSAQPPHPAGTNLWWLLGKGEGASPLWGCLWHRHAVQREQESCAHPSILNSGFRFVWVAQENPKIPEIQCSLNLSSPRLPEVRRSHTINLPLFSVLIPVPHF